MDIFQMIVSELYGTMLTGWLNAVPICCITVNPQTVPPVCKQSGETTLSSLRCFLFLWGSTGFNVNVSVC